MRRRDLFDFYGEIDKPVKRCVRRPVVNAIQHGFEHKTYCLYFILFTIGTITIIITGSAQDHGHAIVLYTGGLWILP